MVLLTVMSWLIVDTGTETEEVSAKRGAAGTSMRKRKSGTIATLAQTLATGRM